MLAGVRALIFIFDCVFFLFCCCHAVGVMSDAEAAQEKRPAEGEAPQPVAKRAKVQCSVAEGKELIQAAISSAELDVPWSASLRTLLLALLPAALESEQRSTNDETVLEMLAGILKVEESRVEAKADKAKERAEASSSRRTKAEEAVTESDKSLAEISQERDAAWKNLPCDADFVRAAEKRSLDTMQKMAACQKETTEEIKRDHFDPVKAGNSNDGSELQKTTAILSPLFKQISANATNPMDVLGKKPEDRGSFGSTVVDMLEKDLQKHIEALEDQVKRVSCEAEALEAAEAPPQEFTVDMAEGMLNQFKLTSVVAEKNRAVTVKRDNLEPLISGADGPAVKKHQGALNRVCKKIPECKALVPKLQAALSKKPADRSDADNKVIEELSDAMDKRVAQLEQQIKEAGYDETSAKKAAAELNNVKQLLDLETKERDAKQKEVTKEKNSLMELKNGCFEPLKTGSWALAYDDPDTAEVPKPLTTSLRKLFKVVGQTENQKTLITVLKTRPESRAAFDNVLVQQLEESLTKKVDEINEKADAGSEESKYGLLKKAAAEADTAQEALDDAREKQHTNLKDAVTAEARRRSTEEMLEKRRDAVKDRIEEEKSNAEEKSQAENALEEVKKARGALAFLRGRELSEEEPEQADAGIPEQKDADMNAA